MPIIILILVAMGLLILRLAKRQYTLVDLPPGRVVYLDTSQFVRLQSALYDPVTRLSGKPDYIIRDHDAMIPVELKSGRAPIQPYPGHTLQLAAYCRLAGEVYGQRPEYGIIKYADRSFAIDFDSRLENQLLDILAEVRRSEQHMPDRSHDSARRCRACGHKEICDQGLD